MLKLDLVRQPDGTYEDIVISCSLGELCIHVAGTSPHKIRTQITGPREIQVRREKKSKS